MEGFLYFNYNYISIYCYTINLEFTNVYFTYYIKYSYYLNFK